MDDDIRDKIVFHHIGESVISLQKLASRYQVEKNIKSWGYRSHKECLDILAGMDAFCFILDSKNPNSGNTIGGKVYEYLFLKKPILALVPEKGEAAEIINNTQSGMVIDPYQSATIADQLCRWIKDKSAMKIDSTIDFYDRFELAQKYGKFLELVISKHCK